MLRALSRWPKRLGAKVRATLPTRRDLAAQLDDAITSAQAEDRRLREHATAAIERQREAGARLDEAMEELVKLAGYTAQARFMADEAAATGDASRLDEHASSARSFAARLSALEGEVADLGQHAAQTAEEVERATAAVRQHATDAAAQLATRAEGLPPAEQPDGQARAREVAKGLLAPVGSPAPDARRPSGIS